MTRAAGVAALATLAASSSARPARALELLHEFFADGTAPNSRLSTDGAGNFYGTTEYGGLQGCGSIFRVQGDGSGYTQVHSFSCGPWGARPMAPPTSDGTGWLHGTTSYGGSSGQGLLYRVRVDGTQFEPWKSFGGSDGAHPRAALAYDGVDTFYGTALDGGSQGAGTLFAVTPASYGFLKLYDFGSPVPEPPHFPAGGSPFGGVVVEGGLLYGQTFGGGEFLAGAVYRFDLGSDELEVLHSFAGGGGDGRYPYGELVHVPGSPEWLYGTTREGGDGNWGTIFRLRTDGSALELLHEFTIEPNEGTFPYGGLARDAFGNFYGTTESGGGGYGVLFHVNATGNTYQVLHEFQVTAGDGGNPRHGVVLDGSGGLLGTTVLGGAADEGTLYRIATSGSGYQVLHEFRTDGARPIGELARDSRGNWYGATNAGGRGGQGVIYRLDGDGVGYTVLHSFFDAGDTSRHPLAGPTWVAPDWLYGTAAYGGPSNDGVVFRLRTDGTEFAVVHAFAGGPDDGATPIGELQIDGAWIYGATQQGGAHGGGTLYRAAVDSSDHMLLHSFGGPGDGFSPVGGPLLVGFTSLYGATWGGGAADLGTIFRASFDGSAYEQLHEFSGGTDGSRPRPPAFVAVAAGMPDVVLGATQLGGDGDVGTIYRLDAASRELETIHAFEGTGPYGGVHPALTSVGGTLFGFSTSGGAWGAGALHRLQSDGSGFAGLHDFSGADGRGPQSIRFDDGRLAGTTSAGGAFDHGVLFALELPEIFVSGMETGDFAGWSSVIQ